jgi:hypothetical protein
MIYTKSILQNIRQVTEVGEIRRERIDMTGRSKKR